MHSCIYVMVLNWNRSRETARCLAALRSSSYPNLHVLVVANGSTDVSVEHRAPWLSRPVLPMRCAGATGSVTRYDHAQPNTRWSPQGRVELSHATRPLRSRANRNT
jgi:GT2 family glycosyltransferase